MGPGIRVGVPAWSGLVPLRAALSWQAVWTSQAARTPAHSHGGFEMPALTITRKLTVIALAILGGVLAAVLTLTCHGTCTATTAHAAATVVTTTHAPCHHAPCT